MARKIPGIKIVWVQWLHDSIALWQRQDETPYLLAPPEPPSASGSGGGALASPPSESDAQQISSDPEPDADDWDHYLEGEGSGRALGPLGVEGAGAGEQLELDEVDWDDINNEVEAAMNESDDDGDGRSARSTGGMSDDEAWTDESNSIIR